MFFQVLSLNFAATLVVTLDYFTETSIVMSLKIFINYDRLTSRVLTLCSPKSARGFVLIHVSSFQSYIATLFE